LLSLSHPTLIFNHLEKIFKKPEKYFNLNNVVTSHHFKKTKKWNNSKYIKLPVNQITTNFNNDIPDKMFLVHHILDFYNISKQDTLYIGTKADSVVLLNNHQIASICFLYKTFSQENFINTISKL